MHFRLLLFIFLLVAGGCYAQISFVNDSLSKMEEETYMESPSPSKVHFSKDRWDEAKKGIAYEKDTEEKQPERTKSSPPISLNAIKYLFFGVAIVILIALLTFLVMQMNFTKRPKSAVEATTFHHIPEKEEDLLSLDLEPQIQEAIQQQHFAIATRLLYLLALQRLVKAQLLHWSKDQTNRHMLYLLHNRPFAPLLQLVFTTYEAAWFGQKAMDMVGFQGFQSTHADLLRQIEESKR